MFITSIIYVSLVKYLLNFVMGLGRLEVSSVLGVTTALEVLLLTALDFPVVASVLTTGDNAQERDGSFI